MATRLRSPTRLAPASHARPLSWQEAREARAIRMALILVVVAVHAEGFTAGAGPVPDDPEERWAWVRAQLAPLARLSPTVRGICQVLDPQYFSRSWYTRPALDRQIRSLQRRVRRLAQVMAGSWSRHSARSRGTTT